MRKLLRGLGIFLMSIAGLGMLVTVICSIPMARDLGLSLGANLLIILCILLMYFGLFSLGRLIYRAGCRPPKEPVKKAPASSAVDAGKQQNPRKTAPVPQTADGSGTGNAKAPAGTEGFPPKARSPIVYDEQFVLYRNEFAKEEASQTDRKKVPSLASLLLREGKLVLHLESVRLGELFSGSMFAEEQQEKGVPISMLSDLNSESLKLWIGRAMPDMAVLNWSSTVDWDDLSDFCRLVRQQTAELSCQNVYLTYAPFAILNRPEWCDLEDNSGVSTWLVLKDGVKLGDALEEAERFAKNGKTVLLAKDPKLLSRISAARRKTLENERILVGLLQGEDGMADLVTGKLYRVQRESLTGATEVASAFSRWTLTAQEN